VSCKLDRSGRDLRLGVKYFIGKDLEKARRREDGGNSTSFVLIVILKSLGGGGP